MRDALAAWGISGASFLASINVATDILQFLTALLAFVTAVIGSGLLFKQWRAKRKP